MTTSSIKKILAFGATSAIAHDTLRFFAAEGAEFFLTGRSSEKLLIVEKDLLARGAKNVVSRTCDITDLKAQQEVIAEAFKHFNSIDVALVAYGELTDQFRADSDAGYVAEQLGTNFVSIAALLTFLAHRCAEQRSGSLAVISSVAGDRGRKGNYVYGAAKGGLSVFLQGLRNRLHEKGVHVLTVKPGFVDTPMTAHLKKGALFASSHDVGRSIYQAILSRTEVLYTPWFWQVIMGIICAIPEKIFKRLSI